MRVLILSRYTDPAGVGITLKRAFDRYTDHEVRFVRRKPDRFGYPSDIVWPLRTTSSEVEELIQRADMIHLVDQFYPTDKPRLIHHHGSPYWRRPEWNRATAEEQGVRAIAATHDLAVEGMEWVPNPVPIDELQEVRRTHYQPGQMLVVQTPSSREGKNTDEFLAAARGLNHRIIEGVDWTTSLREKSKADVLFDSFFFGYGNTSLEAWAMGIPTVSGVRDPRIEHQIIDAIGYLPYLSAEPATLRDRLTAIVTDSELRDQTQAAGWQAVNDFHDDRKVVERWGSIYEEVLCAS